MSSLPFHPLIPNMQALGITKRGLPIWPVMGGSEDAPPPPPPAPVPPAPPAPPVPPGVPPAEPDRGYPPNTPLAEMTVDQREAYYKFHNRKAESKLNEFNGVTPEQVQQMQQRIEELEGAQLTAGQKALKDAEKAARAAADAEWRPKVQAMQLKSAASQVIKDAEQLNAFMAITDPAKFAGESGEIDEEKVIGHLTAIFGGSSGRPPGQQQQHQQPPNWGQHSGGNGSTTRPGDAGKAAAQKRFGTST